MNGVVAIMKSGRVSMLRSKEDIKAKLKSNFSDLFNALENKNKTFFGIEEVPTV